MDENKSNIGPDNKDIEDNKILAVLSYVSILFILPLFLKKDSKFAQFHAKQGLILFVLELFTFIPFFGQILFVIALVLAVLGAYNAWNGKYWVMPLFGKYASKINI